MNKILPVDHLNGQKAFSKKELSVIKMKTMYAVSNLTEPKLIECINKIKNLLNGKTSRRDVSDWAGSYVYADDPEVEDTRVWDMLILLSGIDLKDSAETYLHSTDDLNDWIKQNTE